MSDDKKAAKAPTWTEFSDITTFHGIRYIPSTMRCRGVVWTTLVIAVLVLFIYQVATRTRDYLRYDSTVTIKMNYRPMLPFPRVTICNQNPYRLTAAADRQIYEFLLAVYNKSDEAELMQMGRDLNLEGEDPTEFLKSMAHQKEDMFESCQWDGVPCDIDLDFEPAMTDMGLCYTFNPHNQSQTQRRRDVKSLGNIRDQDNDDKRMKRVEHAGQEKGLKLMLNIERYEHLTSKSTSGIKFLLHSPADYPLVKGLGFSAAPGTQTLVVINRLKISSLPPPWGSCNSSEENPVSVCIARCRERQVQQACNCSDPCTQGLNNTQYDPDINNTKDKELCDLLSMLACIPKSLDRMKLDQDSCNCTEPCEQDLYEPSMSYGSLSDNAISLLDTNATERKSLAKKYLHALQTAQRLKSGVDDNEVQLVAQLENLLQDYLSNTDALKKTFTSNEHFKKTYPNTVNFPEATKNILEKDIHLLINLRKDNSSRLGPFREEVVTWYEQLHKLLIEDSENKGALSEAIRDCKNKSTDTLIEDCDSYNVRPNDYFLKKGGQARKLQSRCNFLEFALDSFIEGVNEINGNVNSTKKVIPEGLLNNEDINANIKENILRRNGGIEVRKKRHVFKPTCSQFLLQLRAKTKNACLNLKILSGEEKGRVADILEDLENLASDIRNIWTKTHVDDNLKECDSGREDDEFIKKWKDYQNLEWNSFGAVSRERILDIVNQIEKHFEESILVLLKDKRAEISSHDSRKVFADILKSKLEEPMRILKELENKLKGKISVFNSDVVTLEGKLTEMYVDALTKNVYKFNFTVKESATIQDSEMVSQWDLSNMGKSQLGIVRNITKSISAGTFGTISSRVLHYPEKPKFNIKDLRKLDIVKTARMYRKQNEKLKVQLNKLKNNTEEAIKGTVNVMSQDYQNVVNKQSSPLVTISSGISSVSAELLQALSRVKEEIKAPLDDKFFKDNFLQVEIYYKELAYKYRKQQKAFEFLSLLSEIGGFMGLLLGASVLTLFELFDFLILSAYIRFSQKNKDPPQDENNVRWKDDEDEHFNNSRFVRGGSNSGSRILR